MISNTTGRLFITHTMHSHKKIVFFPHVRNFTSIYGIFSCLIDVIFGPILMDNYVCFFQMLCSAIGT